MIQINSSSQLPKLCTEKYTILKYCAEKRNITLIGNSIIGGTCKKDFNKCIQGNTYINLLTGSLVQHILSYIQSTLNGGKSDVAVLHVETNNLAGRNDKTVPLWRLQDYFWKWLKSLRLQKEIFY